MALFEDKVLLSASGGGNTRSHGSNTSQALMVFSPGVFLANE